MGVLLKAIFTGLTVLWLYQNIRRWFAVPQQQPKQPYYTPPPPPRNAQFESNSAKPKRTSPDDDYIDFEEVK
jgi:hypothetical protein